MKAALPWLCLFLTLAGAAAVSAGDGASGPVADAETAIRLAEQAWIPVYGSEQIAGQRPFVATLSNGVWFVRGSLPANSVGGVVEAEIAATDGRVLRIRHGR